MYPNFLDLRTNTSQATKKSYGSPGLSAGDSISQYTNLGEGFRAGDWRRPKSGRNELSQKEVESYREHARPGTQISALGKALRSAKVAKDASHTTSLLQQALNPCTLGQ